VPGLTRLTPTQPDLEGVVMFTALPEAETDAAIAGQIAYFDSIGRPFEWKVYDFDQPADLAARLERHGFTSGDREAFMVYGTESHRSRNANPALRIERITTTEGIRDIIAVQARVWHETPSWLEASLARSFDHCAIYCAYCGTTPVGAGWIDLGRGSDFAELHGGSVVPELRGRGIYSALFDIRVEEARRRGFHYIAVDAAPMSRPILIRKGFIYICETLPFRRKTSRNPTPDG
jgi:GNAT superfamily N-acetyltransferase